MWHKLSIIVMNLRGYSRLRWKDSFLEDYQKLGVDRACRKAALGRMSLYSHTGINWIIFSRNFYISTENKHTNWKISPKKYLLDIKMKVITNGNWWMTCRGRQIEYYIFDEIKWKMTILISEENVEMMYFYAIIILNYDISC